MSDSFIQSSYSKQDESFELPLRPESLEDFVGQVAIRKRLDVFIKAAIGRGFSYGASL